MDLGSNLKKARQAAGMTQLELAEKLHVRQKDISRWESGTPSPSVVTFREICLILKASADEILELKQG